MKYLFLLGMILIGFLPVSAQKAKPPADLVITLTLGGTERFAYYYTYTLGRDGRVTYDDSASNALPSRVHYSILLLGHKKPPKPLKFADRLKDKQLLALMREFEASGFFQMRDKYDCLTEPSLTQQTWVNHAERKALSITANGKTKSVSFFLGCSYSEQSPLKAFLALYDKVNETLRTVKATKVPAGSIKRAEHATER